MVAALGGSPASKFSSIWKQLLWWEIAFDMRNKPPDLEPNQFFFLLSNSILCLRRIIKSHQSWPLNYYQMIWPLWMLQSRIAKPGKAVREGLQECSGVEHCLVQRLLRWFVGRNGGLACRAKENVMAQRSLFNKCSRKQVCVVQQWLGQTTRQKLLTLTPYFGPHGGSKSSC